MTDKIEKFINALSPKLRLKLKYRLEKVKNNPFDGADVKLLKGFSKKTFRLRLGKIRIIYRVINQKVEIIDIDYRGNIY